MDLRRFSQRLSRPVAPLAAFALLLGAVVTHGTPTAAQDRELLRISGQVVEITEATVAIRTDDNRTLTFQTVPSTRISLRGRSVALDQLQAGDPVEVVTSPGEPGVALRVAARPPAPPAQAGADERRAAPPPEVSGALGVAVSPSPTGVYIADVQPGSPGAKVGLEPGSFLLSIGGVEITAPEDLLRALEQLRPQETVKLVAWSDGETRDMAVALASSADVRDVVVRAPEALQTPARLEMPAVLTGLTLVEADEGATVADVAPRSPAAELGLRKGDVIRNVAGERISTTAELLRIIDGLEPAAEVQIQVQRGPQQAELVLVMPTETVTVRRPALVELPADMPEYARTLLRQQRQNEELLDSLLREVQALRAEVHELRR